MGSESPVATFDAVVRKLVPQFTCNLGEGPLYEHRAPRDFPKADAFHARLIQHPPCEAVHKLCSVHLPLLSAL